MSETISQVALRALIAEWMAAGKQVVGPTRVNPNLVQYSTLDSADTLLMEGFVRPENSIKDFVFPKQERLYEYRIHGNSLDSAWMSMRRCLSRSLLLPGLVTQQPSPSLIGCSTGTLWTSSTTVAAPPPR